jgi:hypothetical protein
MKAKTKAQPQPATCKHCPALAIVHHVLCQPCWDEYLDHCRGLFPNLNEQALSRLALSVF